MACGDPMWRCKYCGNIYYSNRTYCGCNGEAHANWDNPQVRDQYWKNVADNVPEEKWKAAFGTDETPLVSDFKFMKNTIGVVVGRFQTPYLHEGHTALLNYVVNRHERVFVFLGQSPLKSTKNDPYDFSIRRAMINQSFPQIEVHRIDDIFDKKKWSRELDRQLAYLVGPNLKIKLYGSRNSFLKDYSGKHETEEVPANGDWSSSKVREEAGISPVHTQDFRLGVCWSTQNQWPKVYPTVDMAPIDLENGTLLLCRKPGEDLLRFSGGFASVECESYENDALRELEEEMNICGTAIEYIGSTFIDDARYRNQVDKIKTMLFAVTKWAGTPQPMDDLNGGEIVSVNIELLTPEMLMPTHRILRTMLLNWIDKIRHFQQITQNKKTS